MRAITPQGNTGTPAVRVVVAVRFPGLPHVGDLEFDAAWPAEAMQRWLALARLVLNADGPICAPAPPPPPSPPLQHQPRPPAPPDAPPPQDEAPAEELRRRRRRAGLSQAQAAAAAGLSRSTVSVLEGGRRGAKAGGASWTRLADTLARLAPVPGAGAPTEEDR